MDDLLPLLRPLARLAMARGMRFADLSDQLRRAFLAEALDEAGQGASDSRLAVRTGLQRRDVARLRAEPEPAPRGGHPLAQVVAAWQADPRFRDRPLSRHGPEPSFDALAASVRRDIAPRALLDGLIETGTVEDRDGALHLLRSAYRPTEGSAEALAYLAENVGDHLAAATANVAGPPRFPERAVHYSGLTPEDLATVEAKVRDLAEALLAEINRTARAGPATPGATGRFRAGLYYYAEEGS